MIVFGEERDKGNPLNVITPKRALEESKADVEVAR